MTGISFKTPKVQWKIHGEKCRFRKQSMVFESKSFIANNINGLARAIKHSKTTNARLYMVKKLYKEIIWL